MIVINFKNYKSGKEVLKLADKIEKHLPYAIVSVPALNLKETAEMTTSSVYAQHIDSESGKRVTGFITAEAVKKSGAKGTLLNHSEHKLDYKKLKETVKECRKNKLKTILCASDIREVKKLKKLKPYAIAFEDPKLISTGKSITEYNTEGIKKFVKSLKRTNIIPLCGAGISSAEDYAEAKKLGCRGVLIASAIANSKNPEKLLKKLKEVNDVS